MQNVTSQRITLTREQFDALLRGQSAEPAYMAKAIRRKPKHRVAAMLASRELTPQLRKAFDQAQASGKCTCGECGGKKADSNSRGMAEECFNKFRGNKQTIRRKFGLKASHDFDREMQRAVKILPPGWGRTKSQFAQARQRFEKTLKAVKP
jgi:hypothetical protein